MSTPSVIKVDGSLLTDCANHDLIFNAIKAGRDIIFRFVKSKDKAEFMHKMGEIHAALDANLGRIVGACRGMVITESAIGTAVVEPVTLATAVAVGATAGYVAGAFIGYSLGAWLAHFIYSIAGKDGKIEWKQLRHYFGFRKRNRIQLKATSTNTSFPWIIHNESTLKALRKPQNQSIWEAVNKTQKESIWEALKKPQNQSIWEAVNKTQNQSIWEALKKPHVKSVLNEKLVAQGILQSLPPVKGNPIKQELGTKYPGGIKSVPTIETTA